MLALVTNPNVAFILLLIGVYGLILEFFNPGAVGAGPHRRHQSFAVALYALALLPINYAGAALVLIGIGLMIAEAHIGAFGAIGVGGVAAFVIGSLMMFPSRVPGFAAVLRGRDRRRPLQCRALPRWRWRCCCVRASGRW